MLVPFRGKDRNLISVGPSKAFDYTDLQDAIDAVVTAADFAYDNPYLITVSPGMHYHNASGVYDGYTIRGGITDLSIVGESRTGTILYQRGGAFSGTNPVIRLGCDAYAPSAYPERIYIGNMTLLPEDDLGVDNNGLFVGPLNSSSYGVALKVDDEYPTFRDIMIEGCDIYGANGENNVAALEIRGSYYDRATGTTSNIIVKNNRVMSVWPTLAVGDNLDFQSHCNIYHTRQSGVPGLRSARTGSWHSFCIQNEKTGDSQVNPNLPGTRLLFHGDSITEEVDVQLPTAGVSKYSRVFKDGTTDKQSPTSFVGCNIQHIFDLSAASATSVGDLMRISAEYGEDEFNIIGCRLHSHQRASSSAQVGTIRGLYNLSSRTNGAHVKVYGSSLTIQDDLAGSTSNKYGLSCANSPSIIEGEVMCDTASESGSGTLTAMSAANRKP